MPMFRIASPCNAAWECLCGGIKRKGSLLELQLTATESTHACFSIVAGKSATKDGSVLLAHNEDNGPDDVAGMEKVKRAPCTADEWAILSNSGVRNSKEKRR
jgi:hypothetical protein